MKPIIFVENIGKMYRIGAKELIHDTLGATIISTIKAPLHKWRELQGIAHSEESVFWALRDVNFQFESGDVVGIVGRNGAGKSTLLKILSRITYPTEGRAVLNGRVSSLLEVGTGFHPDLTGRENIYLNGAILGMKHDEITRKFDEIVEFSGIAKFLDTPVKRYSSGMYVRLAFAVAAHLEPEILIVDEVLAVGDIEFQKKCIGKMENVSKSGKTILFVSHNLAAVRSLCNKGVLLDNGNCILIGTANEVVNQYAELVAGSGKTNQIRDRRRRKPGLPENMQLIDVKIRNIKHDRNNEAMTLDNIAIIIDYEILNNDVSYFTAEWWIKDLYGTSLAYSNATHMGKIIFRPEAGETQGRIISRIPKIPLSAGEYVVDVGIGIPGIRYFDHVEDACRLNIVGSDPAGIGYIYKREIAPFFIDCCWSKSLDTEEI